MDKIKKFVYFILLILTLSIFIIGCSKSSSLEIDKYKNFAAEFKNFNYNINFKDNISQLDDKSKKYLTDDEYGNFRKNRKLELLLQIAQKNNLIISTTNPVIEKDKEYPDKIDFKYQMTILMKNNKDKEYEIPIKGELTVINQNKNTLKISRDWDDFTNSIPKDLLN